MHNPNITISSNPPSWFEGYVQSVIDGNVEPPEPEYSRALERGLTLFSREERESMLTFDSEEEWLRSQAFKEAALEKAGIDRVLSVWTYGGCPIFF